MKRLQRAIRQRQRYDTRVSRDVSTEQRESKRIQHKDRARGYREKRGPAGPVTVWKQDEHGNWYNPKTHKPVA